MKICQSTCVLALVVGACSVGVLTIPRTTAFAPSFTNVHRHAVNTWSLPITIQKTSSVPMERASRNAMKTATSTTSLRMAAEDFDQMKYTDAAWSSVAALTKVADFYQASTIEAPLMFDVMLNPSKHNAGDDAEAAKRVVEKVLSKAGVNVKDLRSELEAFLSKQARVADNSSKSMGRTLQKVLDTARVGKSILGVSDPTVHV